MTIRDMTDEQLEDLIRAAFRSPAEEIARLRAENARLRELLYRVVVAHHMGKHAGLTKPNFADCRYGFCGDWHALVETLGQTK